MKKDERIASLAVEQSFKSLHTFKHGSIIIKGSKKICGGYNTDLRTTYRKNICCSQHAEMDCLTRLLNSFIKIHTHKNPNKIRRKLAKYTIVVVRARMGEETINLSNSMPCKDCITKLKSAGITKIMYSYDNNSFESVRINRIDDSNIQWCGVMRSPEVQQKMRVIPMVQQLRKM